MAWPDSRRGLGRGETGGRNCCAVRPRRGASGATGGRRSGAVSQSRRSLQEGGPAPVGPEFAVALLPLWGFPPGTAIAPRRQAQGTNNRTFLVCRTVSSALRAAGQRVPVRRGGPRRAPVPAAAAAWRASLPGARSPWPRQSRRTVIGTTAGSCRHRHSRWLPGLRPGMDSEAAIRALPAGQIGLLERRAGGRAAHETPCGTGAPTRAGVRPDVPPVDVLCAELLALGRNERRAGKSCLGAAARRAGRWWPGTGGAACPGHPRRPRTVERAGRPGHGRGDRAARPSSSCGIGFRSAGHPGLRCTTPRRSARRTGLAARRPSCAAVPRPAAWSPPGMAALPALLIARSLAAPSCGAPPGGAPRLGRFGEVTARCRQTGGDHAMAGGQRGCIPVRRGRREAPSS